MKPSTRREKIEAMLAVEPHDPFLRYSLAMELDREGAHERSLELFRELMQDEPPYIPAYFMSAQQQARLVQLDVAKSILREGIEQARLQGDQHAAAEMSEFLQAL